MNKAGHMVHFSHVRKTWKEQHHNVLTSLSMVLAPDSLTGEVLGSDWPVASGAHHGAAPWDDVRAIEFGRAPRANRFSVMSK